MKRSLIFPVLFEVAIIIVLSLILGFLVNQFRSDKLPLVTDWAPGARLVSDTGEILVISIEEAGALHRNHGAIFLDARPPEDFESGHILGAHNVPLQAFDAYIDYLWNEIPEDALIVTYCDGDHCSLSEELAKELASIGYKKVKILLDGWSHWVDAGLPVEKGD